MSFLADIEKGTTMTDVTLIPNALYTHFGVVRIAVDEHNLMNVSDPSDTRHIPGEHSELIAAPGTLEWADRMARIRNAILQDLRNTRREVQELKTHWENFGEAVLSMAEDKDWCEEYDEFAEEWGLPSRTKEYEVIITVRLKARGGDKAREAVMDQCSLDYIDDRIGDAEVHVEER